MQVLCSTHPRSTFPLCVHAIFEIRYFYVWYCNTWTDLYLIWYFSILLWQCSCWGAHLILFYYIFEYLLVHGRFSHLGLLYQVITFISGGFWCLIKKTLYLCNNNLKRVVSNEYDWESTELVIFKVQTSSIQKWRTVPQRGDQVKHGFYIKKITSLIFTTSSRLSLSHVIHGC